ncbi:MAG TPA: ABC transporter substrate-binding protein, partial [Pseudogracilibacillus sp.]|nr:ABC transporter substrate-binding protein [Pseudogracilibacillus sp.]
EDELDTVKVSYNTDEGHEAMAQAVQDMWKENLGVDVELNNEEWNVFLDSLSNGDYQIGRMGWNADFNDAVNFLEIFETTGGNNYTNWEDEDYQDLLKESRQELDPDKREDILKDAEEMFMDQMVVAPVYFYTNAYTKKDNVHDIEAGPLGNIQLKWGYITEE